MVRLRFARPAAYFRLMPKLWNPARITGLRDEMTRLLTPFQPISPASLAYSI
jgi:hypothetical protein